MEYGASFNVFVSSDTVYLCVVVAMAMVGTHCFPLTLVSEAIL